MLVPLNEVAKRSDYKADALLNIKTASCLSSVWIQDYLKFRQYESLDIHKIQSKG